jgi:hypothetical protein
MCIWARLIVDNEMLGDPALAQDSTATDRQAAIVAVRLSLIGENFTTSDGGNTAAHGDTA